MPLHSDPDNLKPDILSVWVELGGGEPHRTTGWVKVKCALHEERTASATINEDAQRVNCFVCLGRPIDVYELVMRAEGIEDFAEAKRRAEELSAGHSGSTLRRDDDQRGPRLPGRKGDTRNGRSWSPTWRVS